MYFLPGYCPSLNLANGRIDYNNKSALGGKYPFLTKADFKCDSGYIRFGNSFGQCMLSGNWAGQAECASKEFHLINVFLISKIGNFATSLRKR